MLEENDDDDDDDEHNGHTKNRLCHQIVTADSLVDAEAFGVVTLIGKRQRGSTASSMSYSIDGTSPARNESKQVVRRSIVNCIAFVTRSLREMIYFNWFLFTRCMWTCFKVDGGDERWQIK